MPGLFDLSCCRAATLRGLVDGGDVRQFGMAYQFRLLALARRIAATIAMKGNAVNWHNVRISTATYRME